MQRFSRKILSALSPQFRQCVRGFIDEAEYFNPGIELLSQEEGPEIYVDTFSSAGFKLKDGIRVLGPCALFPRSILHWNIKSSLDINENSLSLFCILEPKIDLLVIGKGHASAQVDPSVITYLKQKKIHAEILTTQDAIQLYNFLNSDHRMVAAGLIPPAQSEVDSYLGLEFKSPGLDKYDKVLERTKFLETVKSGKHKLISDTSKTDRSSQIEVPHKQELHKLWSNRPSIPLIDSYYGEYEKEEDSSKQEKLDSGKEEHSSDKDREAVTFAEKIKRLDKAQREKKETERQMRDSVKQIESKKEESQDDHDESGSKGKS